MGCWCETDSVTQLPINYGNKVRLFILVEQNGIDGGRVTGTASGTCYTDELWYPIGPAIQGKYDDYGSLEKIKKDHASEVILELLSKDMSISKEEDDGDGSEETETSDLEELVKLVERGKAVYKTRVDSLYGRTSRLGTFMVLEDVYQAMIKYDPIMAQHDYDRKAFFYKPKSEALKAFVHGWYKKALAKFLEYENQADAIVDLVFKLIESEGYSSIFADWRTGSYTYYKFKLLDCIKNKVPYEDAGVQLMLDAVLEMALFSQSMTESRKQWIPQTGKGSQSNELDIYEHLAKATNKIIKKRRRQEARDGIETLNKDGYSPYMLEHNEKEQARLNDEESKNEKVSA